MTIGVGGSTAAIELDKLTNMRGGIEPITVEEHKSRIDKLVNLLIAANVDACYLDASSNLSYFTGLTLRASERLHGAVITKTGDWYYVVPYFEKEAINAILKLDAPFYYWQEDESPTDLVVSRLKEQFGTSCHLAIDEMTPFFTVDGIQKSGPDMKICNAVTFTAACRMQKSNNEIALMKRANEMTIAVQKAAAAILHEGCSNIDIKAFLDKAHIKVGADGPSTFKIVLFGEASAYPHGVPDPLYLKDGDTVLIDTGTTVCGYNSDITRTYVFGTPTEKQREIWNIERKAQLAGFTAAVIGYPCSDVDNAARQVIVNSGLGPGYEVPGLPHRTGHGVGFDIHEHPYMVKNNQQPLKPGMCFSIEPMICLYGEFGIRLEDLVYIDENGPQWFSEPAYSIDDPFGYTQ